jgi:hypothetical protein
MQIRILITLETDLTDDEISPDPSPGQPPETWVQDEALDAVRQALEPQKGTGLIHGPQGLVKIKLISAELSAPPDPLTSLWKCSGCCREVRLSFGQMAEIGNPICGAPGCDASDQEMELRNGLGITSGFGGPESLP